MSSHLRYGPSALCSLPWCIVESGEEVGFPEGKCFYFPRGTATRPHALLHQPYRTFPSQLCLLQSLHLPTVSGWSFAQCRCRRPSHHRRHHRKLIQTSASVALTGRATTPLSTVCMSHVTGQTHSGSGMKMISGSCLSASLCSSLSLMHAFVSYTVACHQSLETNLLRSAWNFPIGFPDNVIANRVPGSPNVTPPMSPRTPPGPPPETPVVFSPMTPPELLLHLVSPGTPEEV